MKRTNTMEKLESTYFFKPDLKAKERYKEKLKLIENVDPYTLQKEAFKENIDCVPKVTYPDIVNCCLFASSPLTEEQLEAYKSLELYNHFVSGWVKDVGVKFFKNNMLLLGRVGHTFFTLFNLCMKFSF